MAFASFRKVSLHQTVLTISPARRLVNPSNLAQNLSLYTNSNRSSNTTKSSFAIIKMCAQRNFSTELVRTITVSPPTTVYSEELAKLSPGKFKVPKEPLNLRVQYADTAIGREDTKFDKTIVAIHGTPGYYTHFDTLIEHFRDTNVRVIAPNLPDFAHTRENGYFWNSTPERAGFVKQFLRDLGVKDIDCLVCHSFGIQCTSVLLANPEELKIRSACFFAPQPMFDRSKKDTRRSAARLFIFNQPWWYWFLEKTGVHNSKAVPMRMDSLNEFMLLCSLIYDRMPFTFSERLEKIINTTNIPITLVYGEKERLISKDAIRKFNEIMGISPEHVPSLDPEDSDDQVPYTGNRLNSYTIKGAGHFAHTNHARFCNKMIDNLLIQISKEPSN